MKYLNRFIQDRGAHIIHNTAFAGFTIVLFIKTIFASNEIFRRRREIARQMYNASIRTFTVVTIVALFTGMIMTLQSGVEMQKFGMEIYIANILIATLSREMGPFVAAIILIASVGSSIAAEIATMKVSEEVDALELMTINPVRFLVMPRVFSLSIVLPVVTIYTIVVGTLGGMVIAKSHLNIDFDTFYLHVLTSLHFKAVYVGLLKAFIFGIIISSISCANGLIASNGAIGVGKATRDSVVASFLMILIIGYFITEIFYGAPGNI